MKMLAPARERLVRERFTRAPRFTLFELLAALVLLAAPVGGGDPATPQLAHPVADAMSLALPGTVQLQGWLADKLGLCLNRRVWAQKPESL